MMCSVHGVQVFDQSALSLEAKEEMYKLYPNARRAHLKTGGNFPYLCRSAEVNLYIQVRFSLWFRKKCWCYTVNCSLQGKLYGGIFCL